MYDLLVIDDEDVWCRLIQDTLSGAYKYDIAQTFEDAVTNKTMRL